MSSFQGWLLASAAIINIGCPHQLIKNTGKVNILSIFRPIQYHTIISHIPMDKYQLLYALHASV